MEEERESRKNNAAREGAAVEVGREAFLVLRPTASFLVVVFEGVEVQLGIFLEQWARDVEDSDRPSFPQEWP